MTQDFDKTDNYIIDESPEVCMGETQGWAQRFFKAFPALKHRNYQLYFTGQLISLIGTWLQTVAQGWLVLQLTQSAFLVGLVSALSSLPVLIFALFGGVIVDRLPKKNIIIFTQSGFMILAFILGILTVLKIVTVPEILILAFLLGVLSALDSPARQSFVVEMVGKEDLISAIALNSGVFNGARVVGPAVAGLIIAVSGTGGAFILNGVSYIAVIIALFLMHVKEIIPETHPHPIKAIKEGLNYSFSHPIIKTLLILTGISSIFGWSYTAIMPVVAQNVFHQGAAGLGYLYSAIGLGALLATVIVSAFSQKIDKTILILGGNFLFAISIILFTFTSNLRFALPLLFFSGLGLIAQFSTINSTIQNMVEDKIRGRIMSIYTLMFLGLFPFGSFQIGYLSDRFGSMFAIRTGAIIVLLFGIFLYFRRDKIRKAHERYNEENGEK